MFSNVTYDNLQEDFEQDSQWLAKEWERRQQQESVDANDSDTMSCSEFACIDDLREDDDSNQANTNDNNSEHTDTDHSTISVDDFMIDQDYICEANEEQSDIIYINFPYDKQDYYSDRVTSKTGNDNLENLNFIDKAPTLYSSNCELRGGQIDLQRFFDEEKSDNHNQKREDCVGISFTEEARTGDHEKTSDSGNELTDYVNSSKNCNDALVNDCLVYKLVNDCDVSYHGNVCEDNVDNGHIEVERTEDHAETIESFNDKMVDVKSKYCNGALFTDCLVYKLVNDCDIRYHGNKLEDSLDISHIEEEHTEDHKETNDCANDQIVDVKSKYCNDALVNDCLVYKLVNACDVSYHGNEREVNVDNSHIEVERTEDYEETNHCANEENIDVKSKYCNDAFVNDCLVYKLVNGCDVSYDGNKQEDSVDISHFEMERTEDHEETNDCANEETVDVKSKYCNDAFVNDCLVNGCDVSYDGSKHEDSVDISHFEMERTEDHEETNDCANEETVDVKSKYCNDALVNNHDRDGDETDIESVNISTSFEDQSKYDYPSGQSKDCTKSIKVIVFREELKSCEEVRLHEKEQSLNVKETIDQYKLNVEEPTDQDKPKQNDTQYHNIKHQTTQTCDILFRDKERSPADMFICEYCHKVFANQYKLDSHLHRTHGYEEKKVTKPTKKLKTSDDWPPNVQKLARRVNGKKHFFCSHCSYSVDRCDSITKHMFRIHNDGRPVPQFQCETCGKIFVDRAYLRNHKVSHVTEKLHSCEVCGRAFHRQPSLKRHLQTHTVDRQYSCTLCDYKTNRKHMMYKHVEYHKLGHAYICHVCNTHLYTQLAYRSHMYKHRVPTNSCSFCKVGFSSKERMMCHMRKSHSAFEINIYKSKPKRDPLE